MNSIQLKKLASKITHKIYEGETYDIKDWLNYMYKQVDIIGQNNKKLRNPLNLYNNCYYFRKREEPLAGEEIIYGDFILFDYCVHSEDMYIRELDSLEQLEKSIKGDGGFTNTFTTYQVAIIKGKVKDYNLYFTNGNDGEEYKFIKDYHDLFEKDAERRGIPYFEISNVRLEWVE
ncbi:hypothetical protein [Vallitalea sp.]|jgi:hypothetical protein|uniref:hypothetical protein n=1 Tax=Vallitalea sp. TaxID=1882829 RepID=UPI0025E83CB6|nr:hypothetical protein [Vallitalea sp.]MCT4687119.1 hypothetical protein [Vallitalea sp.]